ncbi:unnamed protein product [Amoebophrya sp. A120]|nr:unnamed protein product [Amoebophrya sp. A120]|eukprot:GSA120T00003573001.1
MNLSGGLGRGEACLAAAEPSRLATFWADAFCLGGASLTGPPRAAAGGGQQMPDVHPSIFWRLQCEAAAEFWRKHWASTRPARWPGCVRNLSGSATAFSLCLCCQRTG